MTTNLFVFILINLVALLLGFFFTKFLMNFFVAVHRRAQEILYLQDNNLEIESNSGIAEKISMWQVAKSRKEREKTLPRIGDLVRLKTMYSHMLRLEENPSYLIVGFSTDYFSNKLSPHCIKLQRVDKHEENEKMIKVSDWNNNMYEILPSCKKLN